MQACRAAIALDPAVLQAVQQVHAQISRLKQKVEADTAA
jgi:hypothetical protein